MKIIYECVAKKLPPSEMRIFPFGKQLRGWCAKYLLDSCGKNVNIEKGANFAQHVELGDYSGIGINASIAPYVTIGANVMMGPECIIYTRNHEFRDTQRPMCQQGFQEHKRVIICDDVWVGGRVVILPGVTIGKGSIIGAGSVVTKDVPEYSIVAGNPAVVKKKRTHIQ